MCDHLSRLGIDRRKRARSACSKWGERLGGTPVSRRTLCTGEIRSLFVHDNLAQRVKETDLEMRALRQASTETVNSPILHHEERSNPKTVHFNLTGCILVVVLTTEIDGRFIYFGLSSFPMKSTLILLTRSA